MSELEAHPRQGLGEEIALLRFVMRKSIDLVLTADTHEEKVHAIDVMCKVATRLGMLAKTEHAINPPTDSFAEDLERAIRDVGKDNGWDLITKGVGGM